MLVRRPVDAGLDDAARHRAEAQRDRGEMIAMAEGGVAFRLLHQHPRGCAELAGKIGALGDEGRVRARPGPAPCASGPGTCGIFAAGVPLRAE